jgi:hypothetical protein
MFFIFQEQAIGDEAKKLGLHILNYYDPRCYTCNCNLAPRTLNFFPFSHKSLL